jgi:hypothetical protein
MKSILKVLTAVALTGVMVLPVLADDATTTTDAKDVKDLKKVIENEGINYVETAQKGITLSGYVDVSYTEQFAGQGEYASNISDNHGNTTVPNPGGGPPNQHAYLHAFDTSNNTFNINAVKIALEKALPDKNEWAAGFRIDTIYGEDARYLGDSALNGGSSSMDGGLNNSGLALEQALVKFRVPVGNGLDIYVGKFVTFLGYEVIESPANLNFSRGLLFTNAIPLTNTGVYVDYKFNDTVEAKFGIVDGWNNSTSGSVGGNGYSSSNAYSNGSNNSLGSASNQFVVADSNSFGKAFTGQVNITAPGKNANICQSFIFSPEGEPGAVGVGNQALNNGGVDNGPVAVYDIWGNWNPTFIKDSALTLGFNIDIGYNGASGAPGDFSLTPSSDPVGRDGTNDYSVNDSNTWWGAALYASYKFNKVFTLSGRGEYLHSDAAYNPKFGTSGLGIYDSSGNSEHAVATPSQDDFSETLTASFAVWDNLLTRVEYRVDVLSAGSGGTHSVGVSDSSNTATVLNGSSVQQEVSLEAVYSF